MDEGSIPYNFLADAAHRAADAVQASGLSFPEALNNIWLIASEASGTPPPEPSHAVSPVWLIAALLLLLANALFVTAEFALVGARRTKIEELIRQGRRNAVRVKEIIGQLDAYLSTCQVGITLASLGLGWIGDLTFATIFEKLFGLVGWANDVASGATAVAMAFLLVTFLHVVIGELMPKTLALQFPEKLALLVSWPMKFLHRLFWPLTWLLNGTSLALIKVMGLKPPPAHEKAHSEEELGMILDASYKAGVLGPDARKMLNRVFRFHETTVREIMVPSPDIVALEVHAQQEEVVKRVFESGYSRLPVYDGELDNVIGIVFVKDLIYTLHHPRLIKLADLVRPVLDVTDTSSISDVLREFQRHRTHMAMVVDEFGAITGLVTLEDIVEELVGEIQDETDHEPAEIEHRADGTVLVDCKAHVDTFAETFPGVELPDGDFDTVGGLVNHLAGRLPREGESLRLGEYSIRVVKREGRRIRKVAVRRAPPGATQHFKPIGKQVMDEQLGSGRLPPHLAMPLPIPDVVNEEEPVQRQTPA